MRSMRSWPGRRNRWYVFARMISAWRSSEIALRKPFDRGLSTDRHEHRCLNRAVRGMEESSPGAGHRKLGLNLESKSRTLSFIVRDGATAGNPSRARSHKGERSLPLATMRFPLMALRLHNTLTQELEEFRPAQGNTVRMYTCGPTVYNYVHIGNLRTFTFQDILRRWLRYRGFALNHVINITDVEDKIIANAAKTGKDFERIHRDLHSGIL